MPAAFARASRARAWERGRTRPPACVPQPQPNAREARASQQRDRVGGRVAVGEHRAAASTRGSEDRSAPVSMHAPATQAAAATSSTGAKREAFMPPPPRARARFRRAPACRVRASPRGERRARAAAPPMRPSARAAAAARAARRRARACARAPTARSSRRLPSTMHTLRTNPRGPRGEWGSRRTARRTPPSVSPRKRSSVQPRVHAPAAAPRARAARNGSHGHASRQRSQPNSQSPIAARAVLARHDALCSIVRYEMHSRASTRYGATIARVGQASRRRGARAAVVLAQRRVGFELAVEQDLPEQEPRADRGESTPGACPPSRVPRARPAALEGSRPCPRTRARPSREQLRADPRLERERTCPSRRGGSPRRRRSAMRPRRWSRASSASGG